MNSEDRTDDTTDSTHGDGPSSPAQGPVAGASRRDFTRRAAAGAAAVAMLANRPAWGTATPTCVSANAWASMTSQDVSLTPGRFDHESDLEEKLRKKAKNDDSLEFDEQTGCLKDVTTF